MYLNSGDRLFSQLKPLIALSNVLEKEEPRWFLWTPVCFGAGVFLYFSLYFEPSWGFTLGVFVVGIALVFLGSRSVILLALSGAIFWFSFGFTCAKFRTFAVAAPKITAKERVDVTGWVEQVMKRRDGGVRLTMRVRKYLRRKNSKTGTAPKRVRVTLRQKNIVVRTGDYIKLATVLSPPPQPVWPGGFDYALKLWFQQIGAVGYAVKPPVAVSEESSGPPVMTRLGSSVTKFRETVGAAIENVLPGRPGALAKALIVGDRSAVSEEDLEALRGAGLAHILAISGLHMTIMAGALYWLLRSVMAAFPVLALYWPIKKIAASSALFGGFFYLLASGAALSTQRAFIMTSVMLIAIVLNRPALTLRNVAFAALIILLIRPESILDVGFQMSFAAASALVAIYELFTDRREQRQEEGQVLPDPTVFPVSYVTGIATTTIIASIAVAPLAAYHFHQVSQFSLLGNILAMPVVGVIIMPMALLFFLLLPFGLHFMPLYIMEWGLEVLIWISVQVSMLPGAVRPISQIPGTAVSLMVVGGVWFMIWKSRWRYAGLFAIAMGLVLSPTFKLPDILVDGEGKIMAVRQNDGLLSAPMQRAGRFSLRKWKEIYGDARPLSEIQKGRSFRCDSRGCIADVRGQAVSFVKRPAAISEDCGRVAIVITPLKASGICRNTQLVIDRKALRDKGAHSVFIEKDRVRVETVSQYRALRVWAR